MNTDRDKALDMALAQIDKQFGKGAIMKMGERTNMNIEAISTGALALDLALGIGGLPCGRIVEVFGPEIPVPTEAPLQDRLLGFIGRDPSVRR